MCGRRRLCAAYPMAKARGMRGAELGHLFYGEKAVGVWPCFLARRQASPRSELPCSMPPKAGIGGCAEGSHVGEATLAHSQEFPALVLHKTISCLQGQPGVAHNKQLQMAASCQAGQVERPARGSGLEARAAGPGAERKLARLFSVEKTDEAHHPEILFLSFCIH